jgi:hypothetical protein
MPTCLTPRHDSWLIFSGPTRPASFFWALPHSFFHHRVAICTDWDNSNLETRPAGRNFDYTAQRNHLRVSPLYLELFGYLTCLYSR